MSRPWMPLWIGDYIADTGHLRTVHHGAYLLLMMHYWQHGRLPKADDQLSSIAKMTPTEWKRAKPILKPLFLSGWKHKRIEHELSIASEKYEKRAKAGKKGGEAKASNAKIPPSNASVLPEHCSTNHNHNHIQKEVVEESVGASAYVSELAWKTVDEVAAKAGFQDRLSWPMGWYGFAARVEKGFAAGWTPDDVLLGCERSLKSLGQPPDTFKYFEKPIARAMAERSRPIPTVTLVPQENSHVVEAARPVRGNSIAEAGRQRLAQFERLRQERDLRESGDAGESGVRDEAGDDHVRLLSKG